jgi:hypothetical protein
LAPVTWCLFVVDARSAHQVDPLPEAVPGFNQQGMFRIFVNGTVGRIENKVIHVAATPLVRLGGVGAAPGGLPQWAHL